MIELTITNFEKNFSIHQEAVQLVVLVSPTCKPCLFGARVVQEIFQTRKTPLLRGHLVWIPMLPADDRYAASAQQASFQDERMIQYWDGERALGRQISRSLKLTTLIAWDIYLLYYPGVKWEGELLPTPTFWMHQLNERVDLLLNPDRLRAEVQKAIEATPKGDFFND